MRIGKKKSEDDESSDALCDVGEAGGDLEDKVKEGDGGRGRDPGKS